MGNMIDHDASGRRAARGDRTDDCPDELDKVIGHIARNFSVPHELLDDPSLNIAQKRAILAEWASDRCAVESYPILRRLPGTTFPVTFSSIMDARRQLDRIAQRKEQVPSQAELGRVVVADFARRRTQQRR